MNISIPFAAAPWTENSFVQWWLITQKDQQRKPLAEVPEELGLFDNKVTRWGKAKMEALLMVRNLTTDVTLIVEIMNVAGFCEFPVIISVESAIALESKDELSTSVAANVAWIEFNVCTVLGIAAGALFSLIILLQLGCYVRHRRHGCKRFETNKIQFKM